MSRVLQMVFIYIPLILNSNKKQIRKMEFSRDFCIFKGGYSISQDKKTD